MSSTICRCSTFCWRCSWPLYTNPVFSFHPYSTAGLAVWYSTDSPSAGVAAAHTHLRSTRHRHPRLHDQLAASGQLEVRNHHAGTAKEDYCACYSTLGSPFILRPLGFNFLIVIFTHFHVAPNLYAFCWTRYFEDCWSQMGPKTVWLPTFFKISSVVFHRMYTGLEKHCWTIPLICSKPLQVKHLDILRKHYFMGTYNSEVLICPF